MSSPNGNGKDVVYIDVDDEITGVIDKVANSGGKVVALVLPKRATVFQSIVNMKLLKKRADAAKKHIVLITSEQGLMPLAGSVGLYVASTLQSKPEIPDATAAISDMPEVEDDIPITMGSDEFDAEKAGRTPVGALAASQIPSVAQLSDDDSNIELDNSELPESDTTGNINALAAAGGSGKAAKSKKDKNLKVPNFNRFRRVGIILVVLIFLLAIGLFVANGALSKANILIKTNTSTVNASLTPTLDTNATSLDLTNNIIPAQTQQQTKSDSAQVTASGKQNNGTQATGSVTMTAQECSGGAPTDVPAGTGLSANGLTYLTQQDTSFSLSGITFSNGCYDFTATNPTNIQAQSGGSQYNVGTGTNFTVAGRTDVSASGSASGGTDNIVTIVQQSDIDAATTKVKADLSAGANGIKAQLEQSLQSNGLYPILATFTTSSPNISPSVQAGAQASNVTVTGSVTYTMYGAKKSDIQTLLDSSIDTQINTSQQSIQSDGLSQSSISVPNSGTGSKLDIAIQTTATIGPHINLANLKKQIEGKQSGVVRSMITNLPGVTSVQVNFSPFWVSSVPKNPAKISISFEK